MKLRLPLILSVFLLFSLSGCQTIKELANIRNVDFSLDRLSDIQLAGIDVQNVRAVSDLSAGDILRLSTAIARNDLPFSMNIHVGALNPADNQVAARLTRLDWTLFLDDTETVSGSLDQQYQLQPGQKVDIPVEIDLELTRFFGSNLQDLAQLAMALAGRTNNPKQVKVVARPIIDTVFGPMRYPEPVVIVNEEVG